MVNTIHFLYSQHFFRVSSISAYTLISEIIDDTKQVIIIPAALLLFSHLVPSLKFKPILTQSSPSYSNAHHTVGFKGTVAARSESFGWAVWIFGQAHLQVIAMKSDEMTSLTLKIAEFLLNSSDSCIQASTLKMRQRCKGA